MISYDAEYYDVTTTGAIINISMIIDHHQLYDIIYRNSSSSSGFGGLSSLWPPCWQSFTGWPGCTPPSSHGDEDDNVDDDDDGDDSGDNDSGGGDADDDGALQIGPIMVNISTSFSWPPL